MPREISSKDEMGKLLAQAKVIRIVRGKDGVKLKARTAGVLYTFKTTEEEAEALVKGQKAEIVEF